MSATTSGGGKKQLTAMDVTDCKNKRKVSVLTAYDYPTARILDDAGVDVILVGDSLGMVVLGLNDTLGVTLDDMCRHGQAVVKGVKRALVVVDMPFMTYEQGVKEALENACKLVRFTGARAVKLEGGRSVIPQVRGLVDSGIAVMGHIGLTPQRAAVLGGFKVQGKTAQAAKKLLEDAKALQEAGCFAIVLEAVPAPVAQYITEKIDIPTIGIGAGPGCDGQVLVLHDMCGLNLGHVPRFAKKYSQLGQQMLETVKAYTAEVAEGSFPAQEHSFAMPEDQLAELLRD